jgi:hypothetical protein
MRVLTHNALWLCAVVAMLPRYTLLRVDVAPPFTLGTAPDGGKHPRTISIINTSATSSLVVGGNTGAREMGSFHCRTCFDPYR